SDERLQRRCVEEHRRRGIALLLCGQLIAWKKKATPEDVANRIAEVQLRKASQASGAFRVRRREATIMAARPAPRRASDAGSGASCRQQSRGGVPVMKS